MRVFLVVWICLHAVAAFAAAAPVDEVTVYETDLSELEGSDLPDTRTVATPAALEKQDRPEGLAAPSVAPDRETPRMEKPQQAAERAKPDVTPDRPILSNWKMTLLLHLAVPPR